MRVDLFDFDLPPDNIALRPASPRDSARLLAAAGPSGIDDRTVRDLPSLLRAGDMLVFNDTRVIPAQLEGRRGEARIGVTLHKRLGLRQWQAFLRNAKRVREGDRIDFGADVTAIAGARDADGGVTLDFDPRLAETVRGYDPAEPAPDFWPGFDALCGRPVLVVRGAHSDLLSAATVESMRRRHRGLGTLVVPDEGHAPFLWDRHGIEAISGFLS